MAIVDTKTVIRPSTSISFFTDTATGVPSMSHSGQPALAALKASGNLTIVYTESNDGLTQTAVLTCADLETYSVYDTALGIELDCNYITYLEDNGFTFLNKDSVTKPFSNTGIDQPFTATHVYTFPTNDPTMGIFASSISLDNTLAVTVGENTVTVVKQYANSADYTDNIFNDLQYAKQLHAKGVTRTITYALVS